jgi:Transcriptional regulator
MFNEARLIITTARAGHGIAFMIEDHFLNHFSDGSLGRVLNEWCEPFDGYYLYYTSCRQPSPAFKMVLEALRYRSQ